jgi:hypothetical protein
VKRIWAGVLATVFAALAVPSGATAASAAPRSLAVSVPADPVTLNPGETAAVPIRVVNPGVAPVTVRIIGQGIEFGDNGTTKFTGRPDPLWGGRVTCPPGELVVPTQSYIDVALTVHMPAHISPDLYYIGFLVTPVAEASGAVVVINQIGAFFIIDVPGARDRELAATLEVPGFSLGPIHIDSLLIGDQVDGTVTAHNVGPSSVQFFGENDATSAPFGGAPSQQRIARSLLPIGRSRSFQVSATPGFLVDMVTMSVTLTYPGRTESSTKQVVLTKTMLVIDPWLIVVVCGLGILLLLRRRFALLLQRGARSRRGKAQGYAWARRRSS